eukprot:3671670-Lingulodinium_polyedra.AAC.1
MVLRRPATRAAHPLAGPPPLPALRARVLRVALRPRCAVAVFTARRAPLRWASLAPPAPNV